MRAKKCPFTTACALRCQIGPSFVAGKVEFCLTKLQALRATFSTFAPPRLAYVLNAFGLFAVMMRF
jgi:hypothetical protein